MDPLALLPELQRATDRMLTTVQRLSDADLSAPSLLPGWSRGHVVTHVARNADSLCNLLTWARTGVETPQYASQQLRDADIEAGAPRPLAAKLADLRSSAIQFAERADAMPASAWGATVRTRGGSEALAATLVWARLREVEIHHVDLGADYRPDAWPNSFSHRLTHELLHDVADALPAAVHCPELDPEATPDGSRPVVTGPAYALAAWLIGRSDGHGLTITPEGPLPTVPTWR